MRITQRVALATIAATTAVGLTACGGDSGAGKATTNPTSASSTSTDTSASSPAESSTTDATDSSSAAVDSGATAQPKSDRADKGDKSAMDAETSKIPAGPMTGATILMLGGYRTGGGYGDFYAVLGVNASGPGLVDIQYVLMDDSGKQLGTIDDNIAVNKGDNVIKVTRAVGKVPDSAKKVLLKVTKNESNEYATVTEIDPNITIGEDPDTKSPVISGKYRTVGKASVTSLNAICTDASGLVQTDDSPVDKIEAPDWTDYKVSFLSAPNGYKPTKCYVGS